MSLYKLPEKAVFVTKRGTKIIPSFNVKKIRRGS